MEIEVTTTELEMLSPGEFKPKTPARNDVRVKKVAIPTAVINHFFFVNVGRPWKWYSRLKWTLADWQTGRPWSKKRQHRPGSGIFKDLRSATLNSITRQKMSRLPFSGLYPSSSGWGWVVFCCRKPSDWPGSVNPKGCGFTPVPLTINMP